MPHEDQCWGTCVVCGDECCKDALHVSMSQDPCQCSVHRTEAMPTQLAGPEDEPSDATLTRRALEDDHVQQFVDRCHPPEDPDAA